MVGVDLAPSLFRCDESNDSSNWAAAYGGIVTESKLAIGKALSLTLLILYEEIYFCFYRSQSKRRSF